MQSIPRKIESPTFIEGPAGRIQAMQTGSEESSQIITSRKLIGIMCHPHPLHGGTMNNKVVTTVVRAWQDQGLATIRFNFRGVGESVGQYDHGVGEAEDLRAVLTYVQHLHPDAAIWLSGFSFGAYISLKVAAEYPTLAGLISLALPLSSFDFSSLNPPVCPWLILHGEKDELTPVTEIKKWYESMQSTKNLSKNARLTQVPGASHFFHGTLNRIKDEISEFTKSGMIG